MLGSLTNEQVDHILTSQVIGRIGCYAHDKIYVVPITYVYHDGYIYAHSREGLKVSMMRKNPRVCFEVDAVENMANWRSVIVWGEYEELQSDAGQQKGMKLLKDKLIPYITSATLSPLHGHPPEIVEKGQKAVIYRIKVLEKTGRFEKTAI